MLFRKQFLFSYCSYPLGIQLILLFCRCKLITVEVYRACRCSQSSITQRTVMQAGCPPALPSAISRFATRRHSWVAWRPLKLFNRYSNARTYSRAIAWKKLIERKFSERAFHFQINRFRAKIRTSIKSVIFVSNFVDNVFTKIACNILHLLQKFIRVFTNISLRYLVVLSYKLVFLYRGVFFIV